MAGSETPHERTLTLMALAKLHAVTDEHGNAAAAFDEVLAVCTRLDARPALERAANLTARIGARRP
jgi:hypothetical protein